MSNLTPKRSRLISKASSPLSSYVEVSQKTAHPTKTPSFQRPKQSLSQSPMSRKLASSQEIKPTPLRNEKKSVFSRFSSQQFLNEIFAGSKKPEESEKADKKLVKSKIIEKSSSSNNVFSKTFQGFNCNSEDKYKISENDEFFGTKSVISQEFTLDSPVPSGKVTQDLNDSVKSSLKSQKSDPQYFKIAEKLSKDFSLVLRKKPDAVVLEKYKFAEDIKTKDTEIVKLKHVIHESMNKIHGLKIKLASYNSNYSPLAKCSGAPDCSKSSVYDMKNRLFEDFDKVNFMIDRVFSDLSELNESKLREKELKRQLSELYEREVFLQTKFEIEKNKLFNLTNSKIESERSHDRKEVTYTKDKLNLQQKIQDLENDILKLQKEKESALKQSKDNTLQTEKFSFYARNMEIDLVKSREQCTKYQKEVEILKEKLKNKEVTEELLRLKLKNFEENSNSEAKNKNLNEKIDELEENLRLKNAEISELKYKLCIYCPGSGDPEENTDRGGKLMNRLQEISGLTKTPEKQVEKMLKSKSKELKMLKISLDLMQKENSILQKNKERVMLVESDRDELVNKLSKAEENIRKLEKENSRLGSELIQALNSIESAEKSTLAYSYSTKQQKEQIKHLKKTKESILEESESLKHSLSLKNEKLSTQLEKLDLENLQKSSEIDSLKNDLNKLKSTLSSKELELAYLTEKESIIKTQIQDCISEMKQIKLESKKLKDENFKQNQELTRKNFEISDLTETEKKLRQQIIDNVAEIQLLGKSLRESQQICESQKNLLESLDEEKRELQEKIEKFCGENSELKEEVGYLKGEIKGKEDELMDALGYEKRILAEIEGIEEEIRKQPKKVGMKLNDEVKLLNEEKFRLKSLVVYKNTQIKMLKDKMEEGKRNEGAKGNAIKRQKSLVETKEKKVKF